MITLNDVFEAGCVRALFPYPRTVAEVLECREHVSIYDRWWWVVREPVAREVPCVVNT